MAPSGSPTVSGLRTWIAAALEFLVPALFAMGALVGVGGLFNTWRERRGQGAAEGAES